MPIMEDIQQEEPIYELAVECEALYARQITSLNDTGDESTAKVLSDMYQRFESWASFLGVFAESNLCLDRRLRRHPDIQDQVLRLLDIMQGNLTHLLGDSDAPESPAPQAESLDIASRPVSAGLMQSLKAISAALDRLNHLGTAIRRSIVANHTLKARQLAEKFDLTSFEQVAYVLLKSLYPDSSETLIEQLTRSMTESYALFLHRQSRRGQFEAVRKQRAQPFLHQIPEELVVDQSVGDVIDVRALPARRDNGQVPDRQQAPSIQLEYTVSRSEPTSIDSEEVRARLKRLRSPSAQSRPVSILVSQAGYSRLRGDNLMCEWCFNPLMPDCLEGPRWQQHVNEDFNPFVCISEKCSQRLQRFPSSTQWFQHMTGEHGDGWHREVHAPSSWVCPLCTYDDGEFSSPDMLSEHLRSDHDDIFQEQQVKAIVRQSRFPSLRSQATCPLCCFPISEEDSNSSRTEHGPSDEGKQYLAKPADNGPKRIRIDTDPEEQTGKPVSTQTVATHVSAHLQSIMVFTLRLMSIEGPTDVGESQSSATDTDYQASWSSSGPRDLDLDQDMSDDAATVDEDSHDVLDAEYSPLEGGDAVPDSEYTDWHEIPRGHEDKAGDYTTDAGIQDTGNTSTKQEDEAPSQLQARSNLIQELLYSECNFATDMKAVVDIYAALQNTPIMNSQSENIREIIQTSHRLLQCSIDFQYHLREAATNVCPYPPLEDWLPFQDTLDNSQPPGPLLETDSMSSEEKHRKSFIGKAFVARVPRMVELLVGYIKSKTALKAQLVAVQVSMLLDKPMRRFLSYRSFLESLIQLTPDEYPDRELLTAALEEVSSFISRWTQDMKRQDVLQQARVQALQLEAGERTGSPDQDPEFERLVDVFRPVILQVQGLMELARTFEFPMFRLIQTVAAMQEVATLDDATLDNARFSNLQAVKSTVEDITRVMLPEYSRLVRWRISDRLDVLLDLYKKVGLTIAHRDIYLAEAKEEFQPLNQTLKHELPKLYSLTREVAQRCLHSLLELQIDWLKEVHDKLERALDSYSFSLEELADFIHAKQRVLHADALTLAICDGSLLDRRHSAGSTGSS